MVKSQRLLASKSSAHQPGQGGCLRVTRRDNSTLNGIGPARGSFFPCGIRPGLADGLPVNAGGWAVACALQAPTA